MFTYLDPQVKERLVAAGKLVRIDADGRPAGAEPAAMGGVRALSILGPIPLPLVQDGRTLETAWYACVRHTELTKVEELADALRQSHGQQSFATLASSMAVNSVLAVGDPASWTNPLVRVHSSCLTGDVFGSLRCECGPQLTASLARIADDPAGGMLIYMSGHEGRGIGLWAKAATYILQDAGQDTYQANRSLGLPDDSRDFSDAASLLKYFLGGRPFRLMTNNPKKVRDLTDYGVQNVTPVKHLTGVTATNRGYMAAKRDWGHNLDDEDLAVK